MQILAILHCFLTLHPGSRDLLWLTNAIITLRWMMVGQKVVTAVRSKLDLAITNTS